MCALETEFNYYSWMKFAAWWLLVFEELFENCFLSKIKLVSGCWPECFELNFWCAQQVWSLGFFKIARDNHIAFRSVPPLESPTWSRQFQKYRNWCTKTVEISRKLLDFTRFVWWINISMCFWFFRPDLIIIEHWNVKTFLFVGLAGIFVFKTCCPNIHTFTVGLAQPCNIMLSYKH